MYFGFQWHFTGNVKGHWGYRRTCCCRGMYDYNSRTTYQGIILILIMHWLSTWILKWQCLRFCQNFF